jgi:hypothetical protein
MKVVAGFAENQKYGLGTNSMTGQQKLLIIYGEICERPGLCMWCMSV